MTITLQVPDTFVGELLENLPEYAISFACESFDYDACLFKLRDCETGKRYTLTADKARKGFVLLIGMIARGELPGLSVAASNWFDACNWDSLDVDALLQCALLGDVVYG